MSTNTVSYLFKLKQICEQKATSLLSEQSAIESSKTAFDFHFSNTISRSFQYYYCETVSNPSHFLSSNNFFRVFKQKYGLQGIDNDYLDNLELHKPTILQLIIDDRLADLYFNYFANALIKHGDKINPRNLGSFFSKLVHTFRPSDYCALDNPIKNYLGLRGEGFYVAFMIVSEFYTDWVAKNKDIMDFIRHGFELDSVRQPLSSKMTDLKLLDLILWYQANSLIKNQA